MDTNRIKRFATEARTKLKEGIAAKIITLGFDKKGNVPENLRPQLMQGGSLWNSQLQTEGFYHQWMSLYNRVQQKGINEVYEEAAYTWFNRLCAIRILQKNNLCAPILDYADSARTPLIVDEARQGRIPQMKEDVRTRLVELLDDDTKVTEQFAVLITAWCHDNPIINKCFGGMADYTELLLPNNILAEGGFVDMLNHTEFITDENFQSPELIGWLYQFYISERKDEVFAKKGKFEADEIPAATQIFTPNWIVKYMVQNTVGRIYLDNNPYEMQLQKKWQYLVEPSEKTSADCILKYEELTDLKVADLACGSGHILNECFDLLYDLYIAEGYGRGEAIENIFANNLTGIDLDTRAKQLATFALLLKACQKDASFADAHCLPNVLTMPKPWDEAKDGDVKGFLHHFFQGQESNIHANELKECFDLMQDADSLGSIMKFDLNESTRLLLKQTVEYWEKEEFVPEPIKEQMPAMKLILALTEKYHALVMNPPYMGAGNMNSTLLKYVKDFYVEGKADLFSAFMILAINRLTTNGKYGMINMHSWMFLSSFELLRYSMIEDEKIDSLLHLGARTFDELSGEVVQNAAFVVTKLSNHDFCSVAMENLKHHEVARKGTYFRLIKGKNCSEKESMFIEANKTHGANYYENIDQANFIRIKGAPIGYWLSEKVICIFEGKAIGDYGYSRRGLQPGSVPLVVRRWFEVGTKNLALELQTRKEALLSTKKWFKFDSGGGPRKWYGNYDSVVDWENNGYTIKHLENPITPSEHLYFEEGIVWSKICSSFSSFRFHEGGIIPGDASPCYFSDNMKVYVMALLNTVVSRYLLNLLSPTLNLKTSDVDAVPLVMSEKEQIEEIAKKNKAISKLDWDAHETSWDFQTNELLTMDEDVLFKNLDYKVEKHFKETGERICIDPAPPMPESVEWCYETYCTKWERLFMKLHENEEELNRQFIDIYGLQDELTPEVPLDEITILQQGEVSINENPSTGAESALDNDNRLVWHSDVVMKQLISYAVGCMMGRYRLDKPGLHIAHPEPTEEEIAPYIYKGIEYEIDDDGIMPLMTGDCGFCDNASIRFADFIRTAFGEETQVENLNFIEQCLGKTVEQYFVKDFWKDHKKMYQNRPIYWLFSSKKGAFQVIAYMHRMNAYTVERVRAKYLLPYIENIQAKIAELDANRAGLNTRETKQLQQLQKTLEECREYHDRLQVVAEQAIGFDLDDGVVVNHAKYGDVLQKIK